MDSIFFEKREVVAISLYFDGLEQLPFLGSGGRILLSMMELGPGTTPEEWERRKRSG